MKISQVRKLSVQDRFWYWVEERESVRLKREAGEPKPWTDDEILQSFRFCNVRRMDDKVSRWLLENWYQPNFDHKNMLVACALARFLNKPESLEIIGFPKRWEPEKIKAKLRAYRDQGNIVFNGAYMVRGNDGIDKIECVIDHYCQPLVDTPPEVFLDSMQKTWGGIVKSYGFGSFMAGQVTADLRWALKGSWEDAKTWAPMGPGSKRGMNRFAGLPKQSSMKQEDFLTNLRDVIRVGQKELSKTLTKRLEAIDWQNCFCEYDKYSRVIDGQGKPKQKYSGVA